jgi:hypothetical protein
MNTCLRLALAAACLILAPAASATLVLQVDVENHFEPKKGAANVPADSRTSVELTIGDKYFAVKSEKQTVVFDFDRRRRVVVDNAARTRVDYSLYDTVGFRVIELRNREMMRKALAAAKADAAAFGATDTEHSLSIQRAPASPMQVSKEGADEVFVSGDKVYFRRSLRSAPASPEEARMFAQFIRYVYGGHPQILAELARANAIPSTLVLKTYDMVDATRSLALKPLRNAAGTPMSVTLLPLRPWSATNNPLERALDRAAALTPEDLAAARQRNKNGVADAFLQGRALQALLGRIEANLMTGEAVAPLAAEQKQLMQSDTSAQRLATALAAETKDDLAAAVRTFADLQASAGPKAYVLGIFEANDRARLDDQASARKLFLDVLEGNPCIAGVYKDLGDALLGQFDAAHAWRSWDLGRRLAPQFDSFKVVDQFEQSLASEHPEFF